MKQQRTSRRVLFLGLVPLVLVTAGCSMGGRSDFINALEERAAGTDTAHMSFQEAFGQRWSKAAIACPYQPKELIHSRLGVTHSPGGSRDMAESDNLIYLRSEDGGEAWVQFARTSVDLCSHDHTDELLSLDSAATQHTYHYNSDTKSWTLIK